MAEDEANFKHIFWSGISSENSKVVWKQWGFPKVLPVFFKNLETAYDLRNSRSAEKSTTDDEGEFCA